MITVVPRIAMLDLMTKIRDNYAIDSSTELRLFQNDIVPDMNTVIGDFVEADFTGYAVVLGGSDTAAFVDENGQGILEPQHGVFVMTADTVTNTVFGFYAVEQDAPDILRFCRRFDTPKTFTLAGDTLIVEWPLIVGLPR